jgi:hypothetical protein
MSAHKWQHQTPPKPMSKQDIEDAAVYTEIQRWLRHSKYGMGEKVTYEYYAQGEIWENTGYITGKKLDKYFNVVYEINDSVSRTDADITSRATFEKRKL